MGDPALAGSHPFYFWPHVFPDIVVCGGSRVVESDTVTLHVTHGGVGVTAKFTYGRRTLSPLVQGASAGELVADGLQDLFFCRIRQTVLPGG